MHRAGFAKESTINSHAIKTKGAGGDRQQHEATRSTNAEPPEPEHAIDPQRHPAKDKIACNQLAAFQERD
jgi:hypothetical protein